MAKGKQIFSDSMLTAIVEGKHKKDCRGVEAVDKTVKDCWSRLQSCWRDGALVLRCLDKTCPARLIISNLPIGEVDNG